MGVLGGGGCGGRERSDEWILGENRLGGVVPEAHGVSFCAGMDVIGDSGRMFVFFFFLFCWSVGCQLEQTDICIHVPVDVSLT